MSPPKFAVGDAVMEMNAAGEVETRKAEITGARWVGMFDRIVTMLPTGETIAGPSSTGTHAYTTTSTPPGLWVAEWLLRPIPPAEPAATRARQRGEVPA